MNTAQLISAISWWKFQGNINIDHLALVLETKADIEDKKALLIEL